MFGRVRMIHDALGQHRDPTEFRKHEVPKLATMFRYRQATNPRDRLYGFLGIDSDLESPPIDYRKPISECYTVLTAFIMCKTSSLDVLNCMEPQELDSERRASSRRDSSQRTAGLPSWCPDWNYSASQVMEGRLLFRDFEFYHFNASFGMPSHVFIPQGPGPNNKDGEVPDLFEGMKEAKNRILVLGFEVDAVSSVGEYYGQAPTWRPDIWHSWRRLVDAEMPTAGQYANKQDMMRAFSHTLCQGFAGTTFHNGRNASIKFADAHDAYFEELWADAGVSSVSKIANGTAELGEISLGARALGTQSVNESCGRRFFITEKGYFGMGYPNIQPGDRIWILSGGRTPYVLRRAAQELELTDSIVPIYHFAGQAYVHGVMYGEAVRDAVDEEGDLNVRRILLS